MWHIRRGGNNENTPVFYSCFYNYAREEKKNRCMPAAAGDAATGPRLLRTDGDPVVRSHRGKKKPEPATTHTTARECHKPHPLKKSRSAEEHTAAESAWSCTAIMIAHLGSPSHSQHTQRER